MKRRQFVKTGLLGVSALMASSGRVLGQTPNPPFNMKFSPEFEIFGDIAGEDLDQIRWGYDQGFRAWESTRLLRKSVQEQEAINKLLQQLGMEFGQFVGYADFTEVTFAGRDENLRKKVLTKARESVEVAKRMNTKIVHIVLGKALPTHSGNFQLANAIELLKRLADIYEPHGITMIMEPMNRKLKHPDVFLHTIPQAYALATAVDSPSIKVLFDVYHVQIQSGNLIPTFDYASKHIGYVQLGDTPGRKEPGTGEINFANVLQHIHDKGYRGFVGLEHGVSGEGKEGEWATLKAYRSVDPR